MKHLAALRKKNDKSIYKKYTINNVNSDDVDEILNVYITTHNEKFVLFFINVNLK